MMTDLYLFVLLAFTGGFFAGLVVGHMVAYRDMGNINTDTD